MENNERTWYWSLWAAVTTHCRRRAGAWGWNNRNVFLTVLEAESLRSGCWHGRVPARPLFPACRQLSSCWAFRWWSKRESKFPGVPSVPSSSSARWTAARQAFLFFTVSRSLFKFMAIESVSLLTRELIPSFGPTNMTSTNPNYLPNAPSPNTITLGIRTWTYTFGEDQISSP